MHATVDETASGQSADDADLTKGTPLASRFRSLVQADLVPQPDFIPANGKTPAVAASAQKPSARRRVGPLRLVVAGKITLALVVAVTTALLIISLRQTALVNGANELTRLSLILADHAERTFQAVELVQTGLLAQLNNENLQTPDDFRRVMSTLAMNEELRARGRALPQLEAVVAVDADGKVINDSRHWPIPDMDVADRDYFKVLRNDPAQLSFIGEPILLRLSGTWSMFISRKVTNSHGQFLGLLLSAVQLSYFEQLYHSVARSDTMVLSLFRSNGILLARYPHVDLRVGQSFDMGGIFVRLKETPSGGVITRHLGQFDGVDRMTAATSMNNVPFVVTVSASVSSLLTEWRTQAVYLLGLAVILELVIAIIGLLMVRQLRSQTMLHEARAAQTETEAELALSHERERVSQELHIQNLRFEAALDNMTQALGVFDAYDALVVANTRLADMFSLPRASVAPGMTAQTLLGSIAARSILTLFDIESMNGSFQQFKIDRKRVARLQELADGRTLAVNFVPMEAGGWLVTFEDISERRQAEARINHMAHHDALTGLPNRVLFHEKLAEAVARSRRGEPSAVLYLDLDHFKAVNDTLGHPAGDALLREVTRRLNEQVREIDTVARLGGDEFAIVLSSADQPTDATALAVRLIDGLSAPYDLDGQQVIIGTSIGIAVIPGDGEDPDELLKNADLALYRAKADGRGRYRFFAPEMDARMQLRRTLELDLRKALIESQFAVYYQPLMNVKTRTLTGFEALVRWIHPQRGMVPPNDFIPVAEEIGLIVPLGQWVLQQACADAVTWPGSPKIAVNLSAVQFGSRTLVEDVAAALAASGLDPARLELEITETVMLEDTDAVLVILHRLRDLGVRIAMDDFGTGYSSLSYLRRFPFSKVKIDKSFVDGLGKGGDCDVIIGAIADLCERLGMTTTAEGVETDDQFARLHAGNCTEAQGYLFSKPRPASEVVALCKRLGQQQPADALV